MLMAALTTLFGTIGASIGGIGGKVLALALAGAMSIYAYWFSGKAVLKLYGAQEVTPDNTAFHGYYSMVKELVENAKLPMPKVYVNDEQQPNAFSIGRNPEHAAVAATTGIMQALNERELRSVMAHEVAHVKHRDTLISTISATVAGAIASFARFGAMGRRRGGNPIVGLLTMFLAPMAASLIQMAISRGREYEADRVGAKISKDPKALASALEKIQNFAR